jgi:hypothetical protein
MIYGALIFSAALLASASAINLDSYTFEQYLADFNIKYHPSEIAGRQKLFDAELARVRAHNAKNASWKETMTRFSTMTPAEKKSAFGRSKAHHQAQKLKAVKPLPSDFKMVSVDELPKSVDWRKKGKFINCSNNFFFFF